VIFEVPFFSYLFFVLLVGDRMAMVVIRLLFLVFAHAFISKKVLVRYLHSDVLESSKIFPNLYQFCSSNFKRP
jgi:hypothetical protein